MMIPTISPIIRITVGLLLLTISLLLMGDLFGLVPNQKRSDVEARKVMAESLAIQISSEVGVTNHKEIVEMLNVIVDRNDNIRSVGIRGNAKEILLQTRKHELAWILMEDERSTTTQVQVPIHGPEGRWGVMEISFTPLESSWKNLLNGRSFMGMLIFVFVFGFLAYWEYN